MEERRIKFLDIIVQKFAMRIPIFIPFHTMLMIHFAQNIAFAPWLRQHIDASEGGLSVF